MIRRLKLAWFALRHGIIKSDHIYVYPADSNPNRFVQLVNYRDTILALDTEGKIWKIAEDWSGFVYQEFLFNSPRRY